jgi:hypothetical protein
MHAEFAAALQLLWVQVGVLLLAAAVQPRACLLALPVLSAAMKHHTLGRLAGTCITCDVDEETVHPTEADSSTVAEASLTR